MTFIEKVAIFTFIGNSAFYLVCIRPARAYLSISTWEPRDLSSDLLCASSDQKRSLPKLLMPNDLKAQRTHDGAMYISSKGLCTDISKDRG